MIYKHKVKTLTISAAVLLGIIFSVTEPGLAQDSLSIIEKSNDSSAVYLNRYYNTDSFNGHYHNPLELIRSRLPGLLISRPGADPNGRHNIRLRGFNTLINNEEPLIVIDGVPDVPLDLLDPHDIISMEVLKDGSAARWGLRGSGGVININTRDEKPDQPVIKFRSYFSLEQPGRSYDVKNAAGYILQQSQINGSYDSPGSQDNSWIDNITRTSFSVVNNLSVAGGSRNLHYLAALNMRNVGGIALNTGYDKINGRLNLLSTLMEDRLELGLNLSGISKQSQVGFSEAFKYAVTFNPAAPERTDNQQYGGYYQQPLYDYYNPLALLEQNQHESRYRIASGGINGVYRFEHWLEGLSFRFQVSETREEYITGKFYPADSFFRGFDNNGFAQKDIHHRKNRMADISFNWKGALNDNISLLTDAGYTLQNLHREVELKETGNLPDADSYNEVDNVNVLDLGGSFTTRTEDHHLAGYYSNARINNSDKWYLNMGVRYEGSSWLGSNNKWGAFHYLNAGFNLNHLLSVKYFDSWIVRGGYGVTGNVPISGGWSKSKFAPSGYYYSNGEYLPAYTQVQNENSNLKRESTTMWNGGFDIRAANDRIRGSLDFFLHRSNDLIAHVQLPVPPNLAPRGYVNMGGMVNRGLEVAVDYDVIQRSNVNYTTAINFSMIRTEYASLSNDDFSLDGRTLGNPEGSACGCSVMLVRLNEEEPAGQFYGPVFMGFDDEGKWILNHETNHKNIGNGLPASFFGWSHVVSYRNWKIDMLISGVFGHDLISVTRMLFENPKLTGYNTLESVPEELDDYSSWNSYYVENGDYLRLDNLTLSYRFSLNENQRLKGARVFVGVDNLMTITGYSGIDPSPRLTDRESLSQYKIMAPGIDRPSTWLSSRTFVAGIDIRF